MLTFVADVAGADDGLEPGTPLRGTSPAVSNTTRVWERHFKALGCLQVPENVHFSSAQGLPLNERKKTVW